MERITIPSTVVEIGEFAFLYCRRLREVVLNDGLKKIGRGVFKDCKNLRNVVLNEGLKMIRNGTFQNCPSLELITLPSTVNDVDQNAFYMCTSLREVVLNDGLKTIKSNAFRDCSSLENISMPSTVIEIEQYAFRNCSNLREVIIHNEGIHIRDESFLRCTSLERFKFPGLSTRLDNIILAGQRDIESKMDDIPAIEWRGGELVIPVIRREIEEYIGSGIGMVEQATVVEVDNGKLNKVKGLITYYKKKEATTLFELALWKFGIDQADNDDNIDRVAHRIEVPGPVKDTILQYLR